MTQKLTCTHFSVCGGCTALNVPYEEQLEKKRASLERLFSDWEVAVPPVVPSPRPVHYRHKVQLPFGSSGKGSGRRLTLGCYVSDSHKVENQRECLLQDRDLTASAHAVRDWAHTTGFGAYDERSGRGYFRHVLLRRGAGTGEILIGIVTNGPRPPSSRNLARSLVDRINGVIRDSRVVGVVQNINTRRTNVVLGQREEVWWGRPFLKEMLGPFQFRVGMSTFFQVNPFQTPRLYDLIRRWIPQGAAVLDVYCGVGSITLWLSEKASRVCGIEENRHSVKVARESASHNRLRNVRFYAGGASEMIPDFAGRFDVVVVDPPRKGLEAEVVSALNSSPLKRVVYVSCNPRTLARDVGLLSGYRLVSLSGVDMFPHTEHVESVAVLERVPRK
ncbi:MAG: 23S rRNA (uracil(1939)-C(5))-methyltransferase RlmD [Chitinispirillaceae bacterium]